MSFLRPALSLEVAIRIEGPTHYLRPPIMSDFAEWSALREASRAFLAPWEPLWPEDDLTRASFRRRLRRYAQERKDGRSQSFLLFSAKTDEILGGLTVSNIRRGVAQMATIGYWMGARHAGKGHMSKAVSMILPYCFKELRLHRVEAACLPINGPSIRLLENAGFRREGYARNYLLINGSWQDHILFSCLAEDHALATSSSGLRPGSNLKEFL
ncbi:GNAT family N-acetyltransferase [Roseibium suaedae]|uniref:[SSU ribosomal protein S5P]-alanine acetyltransferase n=1 Tax=Roseibium suaedae TaxID=735517 RepID=A0A1M7AUK8_9HYPH|nr:GNAT family protein [Roseibium suaedae]SHL46361.1 [SSU ribosomal protein S5P]-alanine acetyltransferase [Roseibium suaedae]